MPSLAAYSDSDGVGKGISEIYAAAKQDFAPADIAKIKEMPGLPVRRYRDGFSDGSKGENANPLFASGLATRLYDEVERAREWFKCRWNYGLPEFAKTAMRMLARAKNCIGNPRALTLYSSRSSRFSLFASRPT